MHLREILRVCQGYASDRKCVPSSTYDSLQLHFVLVKSVLIVWCKYGKQHLRQENGFFLSPPKQPCSHSLSKMAGTAKKAAYLRTRLRQDCLKLRFIIEIFKLYLPFHPFHQVKEALMSTLCKRNATSLKEQAELTERHAHRRHTAPTGERS